MFYVKYNDVEIVLGSNACCIIPVSMIINLNVTKSTRAVGSHSNITVYNVY